MAVDVLPVVGFLGAVLMLARLCADGGLFSAAGATAGRVVVAATHGADLLGM